jgi:hypothetical protein
MMFFTIVENLGYRQLNDLWRVLALVDLARRKQGWGAQRAAAGSATSRRARNDSGRGGPNDINHGRGPAALIFFQSPPGAHREGAAVAPNR